MKSRWNGWKDMNPQHSRKTADEIELAYGDEMRKHESSHEFLEATIAHRKAYEYYRERIKNLVDTEEAIRESDVYYNIGFPLNLAVVCAYERFIADKETVKKVISAIAQKDWEQLPAEQKIVPGPVR